jgi:hypothetical protein
MMAMSGVVSEKLMDLLSNCTLHGEIGTSPKGPNPKSSIPM